MAIPTDYIFTSGTCLKSEIYDTIINSLVTAGWTNVSSDPTTDFDVLTSPGNTGNKALVLQLRPLPAVGTAANNIKTSNFCQASFRLQTSYTPGTEGTAGTFGRTAQAWSDLYIVPVAANGQLPAGTTVKYKVYADASKIIMAIEFPSATSLNPILFYLGAPDSTFVAESGSSSTVFASTSMATTASNLLICNTSDGIGSVAAPYAMPVSGFSILKNPNNEGIYFQTGLYYQSATEGIRGMLDGVLCLPNIAVQTGNEITIDGKTYYQLVCHVQGNNSFPYPVMLIRTA
ncbi:hypothetical protein [Sporomusa sphaeroides]|uniref:hypothetical protein n=1 Tax=Sporomusa sphaeroides TaxID=47679 RepID=UPI002C6C9738|nr:hypothetical protein [Sporomusa sphaeroides]HML33869.1 hypothetical protein [Sporomusa sphaeroides]